MERKKNWSVLIALIIVVAFIGISCLGIKLYENYLVKLYKDETNNIISMAKDYVTNNESEVGKDIFNKLDVHKKVTDGMVYVNENKEVALAIIYDNAVCYVKFYDNGVLGDFISADYCKTYLNLYIMNYEKSNSSNISSNDNEIFYPNNLSTDAYGYGVIEDDSGTHLYEFRKDGSKAKIASCLDFCGIYDIKYYNGNVYFALLHHESDDTAIVEINPNKASLEILIRESEYVNGFVVSDEFVFTTSSAYAHQLKKFNRDTKEAILLDVDNAVDFVYGDKIYLKDDDYTCVMDFNGNITDISLHDYDNAAKQVNYLVEYFYPSHWYSKNNLVSLENENSFGYTELVYNDKIVYKMKVKGDLELLLSSQDNIVAFVEYETDGAGVWELAYYEYNVETGVLDRYSIEDGITENGVNIDDIDFMRSLLFN